MNVLHKIWKKHVPGLHKDKRGIAAVEFALILPLMITAYLGVSEISELLTADRRVVTLARALSDLTAQYSKVSDDDLTNILTVANPVMVPFNASTVKIALSSIIFNTNPAVGQPPFAYVDWTLASQGGTPRPCGTILDVVANNMTASTTSVPIGVAVAATSIIVADISYPYVPMFGQAIVPGGAITLTQSTYMRPRNITRIPYTGSAYTRCNPPTFG